MSRFIPKSRLKLILITLTFVIFLLIITLSSYLVFDNYQSSLRLKEDSVFAEKVKADISSRTDDKNTIDHVDNQLKIATDLNNSDNTRYEALFSFARPGLAKLRRTTLFLSGISGSSKN